MNNNRNRKPEIRPIKKILFGAIFFLLILFLLEFLLSFAGLERYDREFMPKSSYPIFVPGQGERTQYYVTSPHFRGYLNDQSFLREKPAGLTRIFVVGGSAAYGWPYTEKYGFTGYLRRALNQVFPGQFEVINAAGMSFGSHRVLDVLQDVVVHEPDLVIVYSGNNEYVEHNALPATTTREGTAAKIGAVFHNMETYRALRLALFRTFPAVFRQRTKLDITDIRANPDVERGSLGRSPEIDRAVLENYRKNLISMRELLESFGIKGVFCTVPVNIGGWIPKVADPKFNDEQQASRWVQLYMAKDKAFRNNDIALEAQKLREMLFITPDDPGVLFNYGKTLWNMKNYRASFLALTRAKDLDVYPRRALSSLNETVRTTVAERSNLELAELDRVVEGLFLKGIAEKIFIDYCHFTEDGHKLIAGSLLPSIQKATGLSLPIVRLRQLIDKDPAAQTMASDLQGQILYAKALTRQNNGRPEEAEKIYRRILQLSPMFSSALSNLGDIYLDRGDVTGAKKMYQKAIQSNPSNTNALVSLADIELDENRLNQAEKNYRKALNINPYLPAATVGMGNLAVKRNNQKNAVLYYEKTLRLGREDASMRRKLGAAYLAVGRTDKAVANWQAALRLSPNDKESKKLIRQYGAVR